MRFVSPILLVFFHFSIAKRHPEYGSSDELASLDGGMVGGEYPTRHPSDRWSHQFGHHLQYSLEIHPKDKRKSKGRLQVAYGKLGEPTVYREIDLSKRQPQETDRHGASVDEERRFQFAAPTFNGWLPFNERVSDSSNWDQDANRETFEPKKDRFSEEMEHLMQAESEHLLKSLLHRFPDMTSDRFFDEHLGKPDLEHFLDSKERPTDGDQLYWHTPQRFFQK